MIKVLIIGCGVVGLSQAITLLTHDQKDQKSTRRFEVTIVASALSPHNTSDCAGAVWGPYACGDEADAATRAQINRWALQTYAHYWAQHVASAEDKMMAAGIQFLPMVHYLSGSDAAAVRDRQDRLWEASATPAPATIHRLPEASLPAGVELGFSVDNTPFIDPSKYLQHLLGQFLAMGGQLRIATLAGWQELLEYARLLHSDVVINAAGLNASAFVVPAEQAVEAERLQPGAGFFLLCQAPWIKQGFAFDADTRMSYVIPRTDGIVLVGGTNLPTHARSPEPGQFLSIMEKATAFIPSLTTAIPIFRGCGLRPIRSNGPRCELQHILPDPAFPPLRLVHAYGCGGSGYTLCWGMAQTVLALILDSFDPLVAKL